MPKAKYEDIYKDIKHKIENGTYPYGDLLPSENSFNAVYDCSRNTVRRALADLVKDGYVQSIHGKGVRVIYQPVSKATFTVGGIESFQETAQRNHLRPVTTVVNFSVLPVTEALAQETGFPVGEAVYYIQRVRKLEGKALILDINVFLKSLVPGLTPEIAERSIYEYIEKELGMQIVTSKRMITVEHATALDEQYLDLEDYNCLAVVTGQTFNADGVLFEYTQSRHQPDYFCFQDTATRRKSGT